MRVVLLISGALLCAAGLLMLAVGRSGGWDYTEAAAAIYLLISVVPGICLIVGGFLLEKSKRSRLIDLVVLGVSIVWFFMLTSAPLYS